jgi:hypothetical protein
LDLLNRTSDAAAKVMHVPRARVPKHLRAGWMVLASCVVLQVLVAGLAIHRVPHHTAIMLMSPALVALTTGLAFQEGWGPLGTRARAVMANGWPWT